MFITTANMLSGIPLPLQDRMEIIELSSYTEYEKLNIANRYLIPRQQEASGLKDVDLRITEGAVRTIINHYTRESGVRNLEREIASLCRKVARGVAKGEVTDSLEVVAQRVPSYLGVPKFSVGKKETEDHIGLANGLAVTSVGGELLMAEVAVVPGKGKLTLTGRIGDVMQESAQAALTYVRSRAPLFGLDDDFHKTNDIHVHFPDGAVPKDGPSAGITAATCLVSALTKIPVRADLAMTGEITLRGRVLPIGGVKEKVLAAHRGRIRTVIIPRENRKDIHDIPTRVLKALDIVLVEHMDQVIAHALSKSDLSQAFADVEAPMVYRAGALVTADATDAPQTP